MLKNEVNDWNLSSDEEDYPSSKINSLLPEENKNDK